MYYFEYNFKKVKQFYTNVYDKYFKFGNTVEGPLLGHLLLCKVIPIQLQKTELIGLNYPVAKATSLLKSYKYINRQEKTNHQPLFWPYTYKVMTWESQYIYLEQISLFHGLGGAEAVIVGHISVHQLPGVQPRYKLLQTGTSISQVRGVSKLQEWNQSEGSHPSASIELRITLPIIGASIII